jgi:outer membrane protein, heavy metal efflux system
VRFREEPVVQRSDGVSPVWTMTAPAQRRPRRKLVLTFLAVVLTGRAQAAEPLTLERALALAQERSPSLIASTAEVGRAEAEALGAALVLPSNPTLQAAVAPQYRATGAVPEVGIQLTQPLELFGTVGSRRQAASDEVQAARAQLEARRVELSAEVREAFGRALAAGQELGLAEEAVTLAEEAERASRERLEAGAASRIEVNVARGQLGRARQERADAHRQSAVALGRLRLLVGLPPDEELSVTGTLGAEIRPVPSLEELVARAREKRPDLRAARAEVEAARARLTLSERQALPTPTLGAAYERVAGANIVQTLFSIPLPVGQQNQAARGAAAARLRQAEATVETMERALRTEVQVAVERLAAARAAVEAYQGGVVDALQENVQLVTEAYRVGKMDLFQLLVIRRETLDAQRSAIAALEELNAAEAALSRTLGERWQPGRGPAPESAP